MPAVTLPFRLALVVMLSLFGLAACGGGGGDSGSNSSGNTTNTTVSAQGIAVGSSVSVVDAK